MKKNKIKASWIQSVKSYQPGLSIKEVQKKYSLKKVYKMGSNENPLTPPKNLQKILTKGLSSLNRYPSYISHAVQACSRYFKLDSDQVLIGAGSSELIDKLIQVYGSTDSAILTSKNTFPLYSICAQVHRAQMVWADMDKDFKISLKNMMALIETNSNIQIVFISNPNNPTGSYVNHAEMEHFLKRTEDKEVLVVLDEAYWAYGRAEDLPKSLDLLKKYSHLVLLRSMSKVVGLAGLRAGIMLAQPEIISLVKKTLLPFNVNNLACEAIHYCFSESEFQNYISDSQKLASKSLDYFYNALEKRGLEFWPSQANFVMFSGKAGCTFESLLEKGLILRPLAGLDLQGFLRMSIGLEHENKKAIELIYESLEGA